MKRYMFAIIAAVVIAFGWPTAGTALTQTPGGGDGVGSLPAASTSLMRTSWTCRCHGYLQEVETKCETGDSAEATAKKHDSKVDALAKDHPANNPVVGASNAPSPGKGYDTSWRFVLVGGVNGDEVGFAKAHVQTDPYLNEPPWLTKQKHQAAVVALAVLQPAL